MDKVALIINSEFEKDSKNSIDKREVESDKFGYKSLHYVVSLNKERLKLTEYKRFKNTKVEIQIRSVLQHAWAEIEHDIGYKTELSIPDHLKRDFYRAAALIETVDLEFVKIKNAVIKYKSSIQSEIKKQPENIDINLNSLTAFLQSSTDIDKIDNEVAKQAGYKYDELELISIDFLIGLLNYNTVNTIDTLDKLLKTNKILIGLFANKWIAHSTGTFKKGISIFYLAYVLVGESNNVDFAMKYFDTMFNKDKTKSNKEIQESGQKIINTYNSIS